MSKVWKPSKQEIQEAFGKPIHDVIAPGLKVLFCGINPGLYSGATGHHFARPGNRFWTTLYAAGFTDRVYSPFEDAALLKLGYGITNFVNRSTATADQLSKEELIEGGRRLVEKVERFQPYCLAVVGVGAYRTAFQRSKAQIGRQEDRIGGTVIWVLPNPSGLNANYQLNELASVFGELREEIATLM
jgi:double-stranded uracil-DNA glycosylase